MHGLPAYERSDLNIEPRVRGRNGLADYRLSPLKNEHLASATRFLLTRSGVGPSKLLHMERLIFQIALRHGLRDTKISFLDQLSGRRLRGRDKEYG